MSSTSTHPGGQPQHPQVTGNWVAADGTTHTLEKAATAQSGMHAIRSKTDPQNVMFATPDQIHALDRALQAERR